MLRTSIDGSGNGRASFPNEYTENDYKQGRVDLDGVPQDDRLTASAPRSRTPTATARPEELHASDPQDATSVAIEIDDPERARAEALAILKQAPATVVAICAHFLFDKKEFADPEVREVFRQVPGFMTAYAAWDRQDAAGQAVDRARAEPPRFDARGAFDRALGEALAESPATHDLGYRVANTQYRHRACGAVATLVLLAAVITVLYAVPSVPESVRIGATAGTSGLAACGAGYLGATALMHRLRATGARRMLVGMLPGWQLARLERAVRAAERDIELARDGARNAFRSDALNDDK